MRNAESRRRRTPIRRSYRPILAAAIALAVSVAVASDGVPLPERVRAALTDRDLSELGAHRSLAVIEIAGREAGQVLTLAVRHPRALREETTIAGVRTVTTVLGDEGWILDANGSVRALAGEELHAAILAHALLFHAYLEEFPPARWEERACRLIPEGGQERLLTFGEGDLPETYVQPQEGARILTRFSDWRPVDGILFPFTCAQGTGDARFDIVIRTLEAAYPDSLSERVLPPEPASGDDFVFVDAALAADIPVETRGNLVVVPVEVNGRAARFLLDSGAGATVVDVSLVRELGLSPRGFLEARGAGGSEEAAFVDVARLAAPGVEVRGQTVVSISLDPVADALGMELGGVLGYDFLSRFAVEIDYPRARLALFPSGSYSPRPDARRTALQIESNVPRIDGVLDGEHSGSFLVDTGSGAALLLHSPFVKESGLPLLDDSSLQVSGIGGAETMRRVAVRSLELAGVRFEDLDALVSEAGTGVVALRGALGNAGGGLFGSCVLAFDYGEGALWLACSSEDSASSR